MKLPELEYPAGMEVRKLDQHGRIRFEGSTHLPLSKTLALECIGLERVGEDRWSMYFGPLSLGAVEAKHKNLRFVCPESETAAAGPVA